MATSGVVISDAAAMDVAIDSAIDSDVINSQLQLNKLAGNGFRDEIANVFRQAGYGVETEVYKWTIFGKRYIDIEVSLGGEVLGGIETKFGNAVYNASQRAKDAWLYMTKGYRVNVVRGE